MDKTNGDEYLLVYVYVGIGGIIGSLARYFISLIPLANSYPLNTSIINIFGSFLLAVFTVFVTERQTIRKDISTAIGTGIIGSFTTLSTFSVDTIKLLEHQHYAEACIYIATSMILGLSAAYGGMILGEMSFLKGKIKT
ncbi:fluoride efflux transporter CrcB [Niallia sp. 01092]|uniref:fluoride efflux transporter CrcB n=1 Tax=unclassified Niallia TaxID=2837522 RepID=UPI003FD39E48